MILNNSTYNYNFLLLFGEKRGIVPKARADQSTHSLKTRRAKSFCSFKKVVKNLFISLR